MIPVRPSSEPEVSGMGVLGMLDQSFHQGNLGVPAVAGFGDVEPSAFEILVRGLTSSAVGEMVTTRAGVGSDTTAIAPNRTRCRRSNSIPRRVRAVLSRPPRSARALLSGAGPSMLTATSTGTVANSSHHRSSISVALVCTLWRTGWPSPGPNREISVAKCASPVARGSPPCHSTRTGWSCDQVVTASATASATSTGITRAAARSGR